MADPRRAREIGVLARNEVEHLLKVNPSDRGWHLPIAAALSAGLPLLVGSYFGRMDFGLVGSLAGLVFLYLPNATLPRRMSRLMACSFAMIACYTLGLVCHLFPTAILPVLAFISISMTMLCRFHQVGPPGSLFFVMAMAIGAHMPVTWEKLPVFAGAFSMGTISACFIGLIYSLLTLGSPRPAQPKRASGRSEFILLEPVVIGIFTALSLALAQALELQKPYWVPISCLVVIQGTSLRAVWTRKVHRLFGTTVGLGVAWALLKIPFDPWAVSFMVMALSFIVESVVLRHYAVAAIFITPLAILLAEAATLGQGPVETLIHIRFLDTLLGCTVGLVGGLCMHSPAFRKIVRRPLAEVLEPTADR